MADRRYLDDLLRRQARVQVRHPHRGGIWTGRIVALADDPGMLIERESDGLRVSLPQFFEVAELPPRYAADEDAEGVLARAVTIFSENGRDEDARRASDLLAEVRRENRSRQTIDHARLYEARWMVLKDEAAANGHVSMLARMSELENLSLDAIEDMAAKPAGPPVPQALRSQLTCSPAGVRAASPGFHGQEHG